MRATGEFEVSLEPMEPLATGSGGGRLDRLSMVKTFTGDLAGTSAGEMLSARTSLPESAGYVAMERVEGTLHGRRGTFVLQHFGTLNRGEPRLILEVVPDSGTGELEGLSGQMAIKIEDGKHLYELEYSVG